jgi:hypothetical protein
VVGLKDDSVVEVCGKIVAEITNIKSNFRKCLHTIFIYFLTITSLLCLRFKLSVVF